MTPWKKVLFLDIDGVLCTHRTLIAGRGCHLFDPVGVALLKRLFEDNKGWAIVMSSTWRLGGNVSGLLRSHGLMNVHGDDRTAASPRMHRGHEIESWLKDHPEVEHHIILDDEQGDLYDHQIKNNLVKTDHENGITFQTYEKLETMMKGK